MSKTTHIQTRVKPELKDNANSILKELGLSMSEAMSMFLSQIVLHKGLPFSVNIPNAETRKAIRDARARIGTTESTFEEFKNWANHAAHEERAASSHNVAELEKTALTKTRRKKEIRAITKLLSSELTEAGFSEKEIKEEIKAYEKRSKA